MLLAPFLAFALAATAWPAPGDWPGTGEVRVEGLEVLDEPDAGGFTTAKLHSGDRVIVREERADGWLAIEPPEGSICWIDEDAISELGRGQAKVVSADAQVRPGRPGVRLPGPPRATVAVGEVVNLLDRPALTLRQAGATHVWRAIEPPAAEVRYVPADGVRKVRTAATTRAGTRRVARTREPERTVSTPTQLEPIDSSLFSTGPTSAESALPPTLAAELKQVEATHRALVRAPVDQWQLEPVRQRYQALLATARDDASKAALRARLGRVDRQQALAESARSVQQLLDQTRTIDVQLDKQEDAPREPEPAANDPPAPFDAVGLLQASAKLVDGRAIYALIGKQGDTVAYALLPPGLEAKPFLTRRVGVRGRMRFNDALHLNLIYVMELEPLSKRL